MSKILSIVALSGNHDAAVSAACDDLATDAAHVVSSGNGRNLIDTQEALRVALDAANTIKGVGKKPAVARATAVLLAFDAAFNAAKAAHVAFKVEFPNRAGTLTAQMRARAGSMANAIASEFENAIRAFDAAQEAAKQAKAADAAEKREAAKQAKAEKEAAAKAEKEAATKDNAPVPAIMQEEEGDTIELSAAIADALQAAIANAGEAEVLQALLAFAPMKKAA